MTRRRPWPSATASQCCAAAGWSRSASRASCTGGRTTPSWRAFSARPACRWWWRAWIVVGDQRLAFPGVPSGALRAYLGRRVVVGLRPEHARDARQAPSADPRHRLRLTVVRTDNLGPELLVTCAVDAPTVEVRDVPEAERDDDAMSAEGATLLARFPRHAPVRRGDLVDLVVDVAQLSYFDPTSGAALWHPA